MFVWGGGLVGACGEVADYFSVLLVEGCYCGVGGCEEVEGVD